MKFFRIPAKAHPVLFLFIFGLIAPLHLEAQTACTVVPHGEGASKGEDDDQALSDPVEGFAAARFTLEAGESLSSGETGASLLFADGELVVEVAAGSDVSLVELPAVEFAEASSLRLANGSLLAVTSPGATGWVVLMSGSGGTDGFLVAQGATMGAAVTNGNAVLSVVAGRAYYFSGNAPGGGVQLTVESLRATADVVLSEGQQVQIVPEPSASDGVPSSITALQSYFGSGDALYALGIRAGETWVERAEQGDFTPVRLAASAPTSVLPQGGLGPQYAFDQARANIVASLPTSLRTPVRTQGANPARALLQSSRPTEVVIGSRLARTRIIRGRNGGIGVNPSVDPLFRLAGRR